MAMNRNMTMAEKEVRDYGQKQMERAEQRQNIVFTEKQKEQVLEYAAMTGDDYNIRKMVRDLANAVHSSDEEKVDEILWDAREEIDRFPDRSVGMAELKGYGYTADDMFPLRQEMALELHRVGEKVYCLQSDGSHGDYASREMILEHEGLYGIEKDAWQRMQEQEDEIDFEEAGLYQPPMTALDRNDALRMFDAGETVFLITTYPRPIAVRERDDVALAIRRNTVVNMRRLLTNVNDMQARSNLMWDPAMAENGILKCGRLTDFQAHQMEHQLGAYTDCNHGQGLAVIHPVYYRHVLKDAPDKFTRFANVVFGEDTAEAGIKALTDFIKECGLPTKMGELKSRVEITSEVLQQVADTCNIIKCNPRELSRDEIYEILMECL